MGYEILVLKQEVQLRCKPQTRKSVDTSTKNVEERKEEKKSEKRARKEEEQRKVC
jgi:hypothetical protein